MTKTLGLKNKSFEFFQFGMFFLQSPIQVLNFEFLSL